MPKLKTRKGAAKRFSFTKNGKVKFKKSNLRHNLTSKKKKRKQGLRQTGYLSHAEAHKFSRLLPYG